jgi:hypothetical protein
MRHIGTTFLLLLGSFALCSCSGVPGGGCLVNCSTGGTVSLVLTATPPAPNSQLSILSFSATIIGISLTPSAGGNPVAIPLISPTYVADFNRVTSDSTLLASQVSVPGGSYSSLVVTFSAPRVTFCTQPNPGVAGCVAGSLKSVTGPAGSVTISGNLSITGNQLNGLALNANLGTAITQNGQIITGVDLTVANTFSVTALPSAANDLAAGQLAHLDDIMGLVTTVSGSAVTIETSARGSVTLTANSTTQYECTAGNSSCVQANQIAVADGILNADGTITMTFFEPLIVSSDLIEGVVSSEPSTITNQFTIVATDAVFASSGSVLQGQINPGDQVVVTLGSTVLPFVIIDKGMGQTLPANNFNGSTSVSEVQPGMTVAFPVSTFTAQSGATPGTTSAATLALRLTRVTTTLVTASLPDFSVNGSEFPPFFGLTTNQLMRTTSGRLSVDGATGLTAIPVGNTVSTSALFLGPPASPLFAAQTVRTH